jgi:hypothetical protein
MLCDDKQLAIKIREAHEVTDRLALGYHGPFLPTFDRLPVPLLPFISHRATTTFYGVSRTGHLPLCAPTWCKLSFNDLFTVAACVHCKFRQMLEGHESMTESTISSGSRFDCQGRNHGNQAGRSGQPVCMARHVDTKIPRYCMLFGHFHSPRESIQKNQGMESCCFLAPESCVVD